MSSQYTENAVTIEVARGLVATAAPQELPLFRATSQAYLADPRSVLEHERPDDMLGFGPAAAAAFVTPVALEVAKTVVGFLFTQVSQAFQGEASEAIAARVRDLFRPHDGSDRGAADPPALTRDQLARVREMALQKARELSLPDGEAMLLADSVVGGLATS